MTTPQPHKPSGPGKILLPLLAIAAPILAFVFVAMQNVQDGARPDPAEAASASPAATQGLASPAADQAQASDDTGSWFSIQWPWERSSDAPAPVATSPAAASPVARAPVDLAAPAASAQPGDDPSPSSSGTDAASAEPEADIGPSGKPSPRPSRQCREVCTGDDAPPRKERITPMRYLGETHFNLKADTAQASAKRYADSQCGGRAREIRLLQDECSGDLCFIRVSASCVSTAAPRPAQARRCRQVCE